jgi:type II secretory pathway component PulK
MAVFTASQFLLFEVEFTQAERDQFRAEQLAEMAIAIAANPDVDRRDPILRQQVSDTEQFRGAIRTEGAALNINKFLNEDDREVLENLFFIWGVPPENAKLVVDALIDWVDEDDELTGGGGAEFATYREQGYLDRPFNREFRDLKEATLVRGVQAITAVRPDWLRSFSLWSSGELDLNQAPVDLIQAVCGCDRRTARSFVQSRNGPDGIRDTQDDIEFQSVDEALELLGLAGDDVIANRVGINDSVTRLIGIGSAGDVSVERVVVIRNRGERPTLLEFSTRRLK